MSVHRYVLSFVCLSVFMVLLGCNQGEAETNGNGLAIGETVAPNPQEPSPIGQVINSLTRVSFISESGMEIQVDPLLFERNWNEYIGTVQVSEPLSLSHPYTVIIWDRKNHPYVIQVSSEGMKVGHEYYRGEQVRLIAEWVRRYLGQHYFRSISMDRMTLEAVDIGMKRQIPDELAKQIFELISESILLEEEPEIQYPHYPYYRINIEYSDKDYVSLDVIDPTTILYQDGQDYWYYQLTVSIIPSLSQVIPLTQYSRNHLKHLFLAEEVSIFSTMDSDKPVAHINHPTYIHQLTRVLASAKDSTEERNSQELGHRTEEGYLVEFIFSANYKEQIIVFEHEYIFDGSVYHLPSIRDVMDELLGLVK